MTTKKKKLGVIEINRRLTQVENQLIILNENSKTLTHALLKLMDKVKD